MGQWRKSFSEIYYSNYDKYNTVKLDSWEVFQTNLLNADWNSVMTSDDVFDSKFKTLFL